MYYYSLLSVVVMYRPIICIVLGALLANIHTSFLSSVHTGESTFTPPRVALWSYSIITVPTTAAAEKPVKLLA